MRRWCDPSCFRKLHSSSVKRTLTTASGVHLKVSYNLQKQPEKAATVILLHGWLGSSESPYIVSLSQALLSQGFNVIRLNFRDHGHTEALNPEVFHSCRLQEMIEACEYIQQQFPKQALSLIGFSLGANFVLRINADSDPSHLRLHRVISFCPVLSAENSLLALESGPELYRRYFMYRWRQILRRKEQAFPKLYAKNKLAQIQDLRSGTDYLVQHCTDFTDLKQYMDGYSVIGDRLQQLQTQCHIVLAKDDPIIPWRDHQKLATSHKLEVYISEHGGHCGFLDARLGSPWIDQYCLDVLSS